MTWQARCWPHALGSGVLAVAGTVMLFVVSLTGWAIPMGLAAVLT